MSEIEFARKWTVTCLAHRSLEIMNWMDNRKIDAAIKQTERLDEDYSRGEEEGDGGVHVLAEGWQQHLLYNFTLGIQKLE